MTKKIVKHEKYLKKNESPLINQLLTERLCHLFSCLHDGLIVNCKGSLHKLTLKIQCNYLAELIDPKFENFYLDLIKIDKFDFILWDKSRIFKNHFDSYEDYFKSELEILSSEIKEDLVIVKCMKEDLDCSGVNLIISAKEFNLYNHQMESMTISDLDLVCREYWDNKCN